MMIYLVIKLSSIFFMIAIVDSETFLCKPPPECVNGNCNLSPVHWTNRKLNLDEYLRKKEFPITCEAERDEIKQMKDTILEFEMKLLEFEKEIKLLKKTSTAQKEDDIVQNETKMDFNEKELQNQKRCQPLQRNSIPYGEISCTHSNRQGSYCKVECLQNHVIQGKTNFVCGDNFSWSPYIPSCVCEKCKTGEYCESSTSWNVLQQQIIRRSENELLSINYAGHQIQCRSSQGLFFRDIFECIDAETGQSAKCYITTKSTTIKAVAKLIRQMMKKQIYPEPCDVSNLPTDC